MPAIEKCYSIVRYGISGVVEMNIPEEVDRIQEFVDRENFHAAINIAISALNECRRNKDQEGIDLFLDLIGGIVDTMRSKYSGI